MHWDIVSRKLFWRVNLVFAVQAGGKQVERGPAIVRYSGDKIVFTNGLTRLSIKESSLI